MLIGSRDGHELAPALAIEPAALWRQALRGVPGAREALLRRIMPPSEEMAGMIIVLPARPERAAA
jgi:hypothetical protein